jgi:hypothetical protein
MARNATVSGTRGARHVLSVIELHVEAFFETCRKVFAGRIAAVNIRMTNRAHRNAWRYELGEVATGASLVARKRWRGGVVAALMTCRARQ